MGKLIDAEGKFRYAEKHSRKKGGGLLHVDDVLSGIRIDNPTIEELAKAVARLSGEHPNNITTLPVPPRS